MPLHTAAVLLIVYGALIARLAVGIGFIHASSPELSLVGSQSAFNQNGIICLQRDNQTSQCLQAWNASLKLHTVPFARSCQIFGIGDTTFAAVGTLRNSGGNVADSVIFRWNAAKDDFEEFQRLPNTIGAHVKHFTIYSSTFLAFAAFFNSTAGVHLADSKLYMWNSTSERFDFHTDFRIHAASSSFTIQFDGDFFLGITSFRSPESHNSYTVLYKWRPLTSSFLFHSSFSTVGASNGEVFNISGVPHVFISSFTDGPMRNLTSLVYKWEPFLESLVETFSIPTVGAVFGHWLILDNASYLAIASYSNASGLASTSMLYRYNASHGFTLHQTFETVGAASVSSFVWDNATFLGFTHSELNAKIPIYKWNSTAQLFYLHQTMTANSAMDRAFFQIRGQQYSFIVGGTEGKFMGAGLTRWSFIQPLTVSSKRIEAYIALGAGSNMTCLQFPLSGNLSYDTVQSAGLRFGVILNNNNSDFVACNSSSSSLTFHGSLPQTCARSAVLSCGITAHTHNNGVWSITAMVDAPFRFQGSSVISSMGPLAIAGKPLELLSVEQTGFYESNNGVSVLRVRSNGWDEGNITLPISALLDANPCEMQRVGDGLYDFYCAYTAWLRASFDVHAGGVLFSRSLRVLPPITCTPQTIYALGDVVEVDGDGISRMDVLSIEFLAGPHVLGCTDIQFVNVNAIACTVSMYPNLPHPTGATMRLHTLQGAITSAPMVVITMAPLQSSSITRTPSPSLGTTMLSSFTSSASAQSSAVSTPSPSASPQISESVSQSTTTSRSGSSTTSTSAAPSFSTSMHPATASSTLELSIVPHMSHSPSTTPTMSHSASVTTAISMSSSPTVSASSHASRIASVSPRAVSPWPMQLHSLALGCQHQCYLTTANSVYCWGNNALNQLGLAVTLSGSQQSYSVSEVVNFPPVVVNATQVHAGCHFSCALTANGSALCWGAPIIQQLSHSSQPSAIVEVRDVKRLRVNDFSVCLTFANGTEKCVELSV